MEIDEVGLTMTIAVVFILGIVIGANLESKTFEEKLQQQYLRCVRDNPEILTQCENILKIK